MPFRHGADVMARREPGVRLLGAEGRVVQGRVEAEVLFVVEVWWIGFRVAVEECERARLDDVEAELALAGFELDRGDGQRGVGAVLDGDLDVCGLLQVSAYGGGNGELIDGERYAGARQAEIAEGTADLFARTLGLARDVAVNVDGTAEVGCSAGREREVNAFDGQMGRHGEAGDGAVRGLCDGGGADGGGVEGLGLAAGWDDGGLHGSRADGITAGERSEGDVQEGCGGLLQVQGGVGGEMLCGEIEEGEGAERDAGSVRSGDGCAREEVGAGEGEDDVGIGPRGHLQIEAEGTAELVEVEDLRGFGIGLQAGVAQEDEGDLLRSVAGVEAEVGERGSGVRVDGGIEDEAALPGARD